MKEYSFRFRRIFFPCATLAISLVIAASCSTARLTRKVDKAATALFKRDSVAGMREVGKFVPVKTKIVSGTTKYVKGKTDTVRESVERYVDCSSAVVAALDEASKHKVRCPDCPPNTVRIDTLFIHDTAWQTDPLTQAQLNKAQKQLLPAVENGIKWKIRALWGWGVFLLLIAIIIAEQILKSRKI